MKGLSWFILTVFSCFLINSHEGLILSRWSIFHRNNKSELVTNNTNPYQVKKNSTLEHPDSTSKREHGNLYIPFVRSFLGMILHLTSIIFKPITLFFSRIEHVADAVLPESTGLDTNQSFFSGALEDFKAKLQLITPGTKWCGPGNVADNENDVGVHAATDTCCKNHDNCPESIAARETKYELKNTGLFSRSLCSCDEDFYNCLKRDNSQLALRLGNTYFNLLGPQCFQLVDCSDHSVKCRKNKKHGSEYHWSDNPKF